MSEPDDFHDLSTLRMFRLFEHFSDRHLSVLFQLCTPRTVEEGDELLGEGNRGEEFLILLSGGVYASRRTMVGPQPVARLRMGQMVGEESFLDGLARPATVVATQAGMVLRADVDRLRHIFGALKGFDVALLRSIWLSLSGKIRQVNGFLAELAASGREPARPQERAEGTSVDLQPSAKLGVFAEQGLSSAELKLLATTLPARRFAPESMIFFEGDRGDCLYVVVDGRVRISRRLAGAGEETLSVLERGEVFGEMALIDDLPRSADARAEDAGCTVLRLSRDDLSELMGLEGAAPAFLQLLCHLLCRRYRAMIDLLVSRRVMAGYS
jgi:CRP-like cAMP-binding protein